MSVETRQVRQTAGEFWRATSRAVVTVLFGDRVGFALFLGTLVFVATYWRVGFFINDNYTIANTLVNVAQGHLHVSHVIYGPESGVTPGMKIHNGRLYGVHYGLVFLALPFLWGVEALATVADLRLALAGLWSLLGLALVLQCGTLLDRQRSFALGGSLVALGLFALHTAVATPLDPRWHPLIALQLSTMVWAALLAVVTYRFIARLYDWRTGVAAGVAVVVATPVGFWASLPKRHVLVALLALLTVYCFYRSRAAPGGDRRFRALAYVWIGLSAWVFPLEALLMLVALGPLDLLTARSNDPRDLALVGGAFVLALVPFFVTNTLITGHPLRPVWFLPGYSGQEQVLAGGVEGGATGDTGSTGGTSGGGGTSGSTGGSTGGTSTSPGLGVTIVTFVVSVGEAAIAHLNTLWSGFLTEGLTTAVTEPDRVYHTFIRSGYIERVAQEDGGQAINLALLESMPLLAALVAVPAIVLRTIRARTSLSTWLASPVGQTDILVGVYVLLVSVAYLPQLPLHATVTARYLLPVVPPLLYLVVRIAPIRTAIQDAGLTVAISYVATVLIGGQLLVLGLILTSPSHGEAMQLHAWLGLATALPLGVWVLTATTTDREYARLGAVVLGVTAGVTSIFLLLSGLIYFAYAGDFALPLSQRISELVSALT